MTAFTTPRRRDEAELLDTPAQVVDQLSGNLADIRLLNRWFGGSASALRRLKPLAERRSRATLLDVATGSGDIPLAFLSWARQRGVQVEVTGVDVSEEVLVEARRHASGQKVTLVRGDARALPWPNDSFDMVICCLAIHHFAPDQAIEVLREMWRVSRDVVLLSDLRRGYAGFACTWLVTRTLARNPLTKHDGPLSVLRAYTPGELRVLVREAGWESAQWQAHRPFRQTLLARKSGGNG